MRQGSKPTKRGDGDDIRSPGCVTLGAFMNVLLKGKHDRTEPESRKAPVHEPSRFRGGSTPREVKPCTTMDLRPCIRTVVGKHASANYCRTSRSAAQIGVQRTQGFGSPSAASSRSTARSVGITDPGVRRPPAGRAQNRNGSRDCQEGEERKDLGITAGVATASCTEQIPGETLASVAFVSDPTISGIWPSTFSGFFWSA